MHENEKKRRSFGEGLDVILTTATQTNLDTLPGNVSGPLREFKLVNIMQLMSGKFQSRQDFDQHALEELAHSIREKGIIQPIITRSSRAGEYEIVAGERRWRAAQLAGLTKVPIILCHIDDESMLAFGLIENIQRQELNPIDEAKALQRLTSEFALTHEHVAKMIGRSRTMVTNMLRILNLAAPVQELLMLRQLELGHAKILLGLDEETQALVANRIVRQGLSVRAAESLVQKIKSAAMSKTADVSTGNELARILAAKLKDWQGHLPKTLAAKIKLQIQSTGKGRVVIHFDDASEADWILEHLTFVEVNH